MAMVAVEMTPGVPRLEAPAEGASRPRDHELPPESTVGPDAPQPEGPAVLAPKWTPEEAQAMTSTLFSGGGGAYLALRHRWGSVKLLPEWYAAPSEFASAGAPLARLYDRLPISPGVADASSLIADLSAALPVLIEVGVRHAKAVIKAIDREEAAELERQAQMPPSTPPMEGSAMPEYSAPGPAPPSAAPASPSVKKRGGGAFHFDPSQMTVLEVARAQSGRHNGTIRNPEAA